MGLESGLNPPAVFFQNTLILNLIVINCLKMLESSVEKLVRRNQFKTYHYA